MSYEMGEYKEWEVFSKELVGPRGKRSKNWEGGGIKGERTAMGRLPSRPVLVETLKRRSREIKENSPFYNAAQLKPEEKREGRYRGCGETVSDGNDSFRKTENELIKGLGEGGGRYRKWRFLGRESHNWVITGGN